MHSHELFLHSRWVAQGDCQSSLAFSPQDFGFFDAGPYSMNLDGCLFVILLVPFKHNHKRAPQCKTHANGTIKCQKRSQTSVSTPPPTNPFPGPWLSTPKQNLGRRAMSLLSPQKNMSLVPCQSGPTSSTPSIQVLTSFLLDVSSFLARPGQKGFLGSIDKHGNRPGREAKINKSMQAHKGTSMIVGNTFL